MLQGVHGETIVFTSYQQARSFLIAGSTPLIGTASEFGGRAVVLRGTPPRRFRMRVTDTRESAKTVSCQVELHDAEQQRAPRMRVELSFVPDGTNTRVRLTGSAARNLSPASAVQDATSRRLANQYARDLLDQIAKAMETRSAKSLPAGDGRVALRKRR